MHALLIGLVLAAIPQTETSTPAGPRLGDEASASAPSAAQKPSAKTPVVERPAADPAGWFRSHIDLGLDLGFFIDSSIDGVSITPKVSAFVLLGEHLAVSGVVGGAVFTNDGDGLDTGTTNLFVAAHYLRMLSAESSVQLGLGVSIPLAGVGRFTLATILAGSARGYWDLWLYVPGTSIVIPGRYEFRAEHFGAALDMALALYFIYDEDEPDFGIQLAPEVFGTISGLDLGLSFRVASVPTLDTDTTQLALSPFLRLEAGIARATLALYFMLDEPFGPSFSDDSAFGTDLSVGIAF